MRAILRLASTRFNLIARIIGDFQGRFILLGFYFTILVPFGLISRLTADPLRLRAGRAWLERPPVPADPDAARRQG